MLPVGQMSEDSQESRNELVKKYRDDFSRKCNMMETMEDAFLIYYEYYYHNIILLLNIS